MDVGLKKCYYYIPVAPLLERYVDNGGVTPLFEVPVTDVPNSKEYKAALLGNDTQITMLRITIPNLLSEKLSDENARIIHLVREHMLSVLRLAYDQNASYARPAGGPVMSFWNFVDQDGDPDMDIKISEVLNSDYRTGINNIRNVFTGSFSIRNQLRLLADSSYHEVPLHYQYLSLYKILEIEYKNGRRWSQEFGHFLERFGEEFGEIGLSGMSLRNYIHHLRDRCAHIKIGSDDSMGVTNLSQKDAQEVERFLPLMRTICAVTLNEKHGGLGLTLVHHQPDSGR